MEERNFLDEKEIDTQGDVSVVLLDEWWKRVWNERRYVFERLLLGALAL